MKTYIKSYVLFLFSFNNNLCSASVDQEQKEDEEIPSVKWTSTLNFSYKENLSEVLKTGSDGNTHLVYAQDQKIKGLADVDAIHRVIKSEHEKSKNELSKNKKTKNLVVVGISLLLPREDNQGYYMIFDFYRETQSEKILVFKSGTNKETSPKKGNKKPTPDYSFIEVYENEDKNVISLKKIEDYWKTRNKCYKSQKIDFKESDWRGSFLKK